MKYGARHLKRAIERSLVQPLSNLVASDQVTGGDLVTIELNAGCSALTFVKDAEGLPAYAMAQMVDNSVYLPPSRVAATQDVNVPRVANARSSRRG